jgi:hypothetical protein
MYRTLFGFVFLVLYVVPSAQSKCDPVPQTRKTHWGLMDHVVESEPVKTLRGVVRIFASPDPPQEGVLVEVYDHGEIALENARQDRSGQQRVMACVTGNDGEFAFDLPPGKYEVRASKNAGWDVTSVIVEVKKRGAKLKKLKVELHLSH